ncbi:hypothetical protein NEUTE1DRAFT_115647 [Neurospora tetrasperma FGSC 2508]|uniref:Uncharacterized protein n=1 Tax=Neurospora tetrasperma (strain FGSC 2508 / ATCC MYA-4615 / P0657) TaxID=510951 RepID=F8MB62_NEUT8|nr:uncharacterized protein NEUTE1DRAFT_115647 [Neurospora tetrasperma FGSC 2508]EGO60227.1 hypothetical protein NEUTE1DRAFT_115647 [Neurospora tetrasperma FGSC 2508]EGZ75811.1 hypothetical protein NEUTE2DRAFT_143835 [Neurospora tetrasperma FGSC 2509]
MCVSQKMETGACSRLGTRFRTKSMISFSNNARSAQSAVIRVSGYLQPTQRRSGMSARECDLKEQV